MMIAFLIWLACGILFFAVGIYCFFAKRQVGFWANVEKTEMENVKAYNRAVGAVWLIYAVVFCVLGLPLLVPQPSALIMLSVLGVVFETIVIMIVHQKITQKYKKK